MDSKVDKAELLQALDEAEKNLGRIIDIACGAYAVDNGAEPMALQQARISYGAGGLWLRYWINRESG